MLPAIMLVAVGGSLLYGAIKDVYPWCPWVEAFGGTCTKPSPGSAADSAFATAAGNAVGGTGTGTGTGAPTGAPVSGRAAIVPGGDWCNAHVPLARYKGITAQPALIAAFQAAEKIAGRSIPTSDSYRSCQSQCNACNSVCGGGCGGCPSGCAPAGHSCHQLGLAVDGVPSWAYHAMEQAGFCNGCAFSDCNHFSLKACGEC